jgi:hypothetical protein
MRTTELLVVAAAALLVIGGVTGTATPGAGPTDNRQRDGARQRAAMTGIWLRADCPIHVPGNQTWLKLSPA